MKESADRGQAGIDSQSGAGFCRRLQEIVYTVSMRRMNVISSVLGAAALVGWPISDGLEPAPGESHWSFVKVERPRVPAVKDSSWIINPVDSFILARLEREGLQPSREADRRALLRRLSLDLTGLPPSPEEIASYLSDTQPDAYERVVDRLLDSPHFGERMAVKWLDLARYADTNGYSIDGGRHMWAWRDWVIDAFNANMPFDQFTIEQLAGDLIPDATFKQRLASGFNRNHMNTHEGGTIEEEYRVAYVADRVRTTAQAWMALTMGCAQCHDHKYDPVSQAEYYRFFAFFNTITDRGNDGNAGINSVPFISVYTDEQQELLLSLRDRISNLNARLNAADPALDHAQQQWEQRERLVDRPEPSLGVWQLAGPFQAETADVAFHHEFLQANLADDGASDWKERPDFEDGVVHALSGARSAWYLQRTVTMTKDAPVEFSLGSDDAIKVWVNGALALENNTRRGAAPDQERVRVDLAEGENSILLKIINDGGPAGFYFRLLASGPPVEIVQLIAKPADSRTPEQAAQLRAHFRSNAPELAALRSDIEQVQAELSAIEANPVTTTMVMEEMPSPRESFVLLRGRYALQGDRVEPGTPAFLPAVPSDARANRLTLARWLVDQSHPLTARVAVNGYWQMLFGTGIVETSEDFGTQGSPPSHPLLLDWLAAQFMESGWDVKSMIRLMVTSATYRQDSATSPGLLERDPNNRLLARGPRFRLQAEFVRDTALAASGLLIPKIGGPSVRPYQPPGLWKEMSHFGSTPATEQVYVEDSGDKLYRRSLYTIWKRTVPPPPMIAFDAPSRETCVSRRPRTNTPLQALVLLNETGFVEMARGLAQRMIIEGGTSNSDRLRHGFVLVTGREPDAVETRILLDAFAREWASFAQNRRSAELLLTSGSSPRDESIDPVDHAAWTVIANLLLNLSETVTRG